MWGTVVIRTHSHKQRREAKGRSTIADLHSWQPSHWQIIREGENRQHGGQEGTKEKVEGERLDRYGRGAYRFQILVGQLLL